MNTDTTATAAPSDVFGEAKSRYTILDLWPALNLPGEPKPSCRSPFREERTASFSIYEGGRKWKDHGTGEGGDVIAFIQAATRWSHSEIRDWLLERLGIDHHDPPTAPQKPPETRKEIQWPGELVTGSESTWEAFAKRRGLSYAGVWTMVEAGILRFCKAGGRKCYIVTDDERRAAEIRRIDGGTFRNGRKAFPLSGVDKSWLLGADLIAGDEDILVIEGATDLLTAFDRYVRYRKDGGSRRWCPVGILGASVKDIDPGLLQRMRGRHGRIAADGDPPGDRMAEHWTKVLTKVGLSVDVIEMPRGRDLSDVAAEIQPEVLFA